jgi:3-oxoacyl-[acyl-carrier protein] reductase
MELPGSGALWLDQKVKWESPVFVGDRIELLATVSEASAAARVLTLDVKASNQHGETVMSGACTVQVANEIAMPKASLPGRKLALVTGGTRGIGEAIVRRFAAAGYDVAINGHYSLDAARSIADDVSGPGVEARVYPADVTDHDAVSSMVSAVESDFGRVDVIVHGATPELASIPVTEMKYADIERFTRTYLGGALSLASCAVPGMRGRGFGRLIFLGTSSLFGAPPAGYGAYVAAKSALFGLVKSLAVELGPYGITSNMVSPGLTPTDLTRGTSARTKELIARGVPVRRMTTVDDTANLVYFLADENAGYMNGMNLPLTGGPV